MKPKEINLKNFRKHHKTFIITKKITNFIVIFIVLVLFMFFIILLRKIGLDAFRDVGFIFSFFLLVLCSFLLYKMAKRISRKHQI